MTPADAALIAHLPEWAFAFVLVLCRTGAACMLLPGIGEAEVPAMIRVGFAAVLSALLLPALAPRLPPAPDAVGELLHMVVAELLAGLFLGWLTRVIMEALALSGQMFSVVSGQSSVLQPDALLGSQASAAGRLFGLAAPALVLATGLHALPLAAIAGSYSVFPAGQMLPAADSAATAVSAVASMFALALRLAAPFVLASVLWHVLLALLSRLVPQLPVFFIAAPAQLAGGIALLGLLGAAVLGMWQQEAAALFAALPGAAAGPP